MKTVFVFLLNFTFLVKVYGNIIYVDNQLTQSCNGNYSVSNRNCSGNDGDAYVTLQGAANVVQPGDTVYIRGGLYKDTLTNCVGAICHVVRVNTPGTAQYPILFQNYPGEQVILWGFGFQDADLNLDGKADGVTYPSKREYLFYITADYIHVKGIEVMNSQDNGLLIDGDYNQVENIVSHDNFGSGILIGKSTTVNENIVRYSESHNNRHGSGIFLSVGFNNIVEHCLGYNNGREPNGNKVLPINGDAAGGGNSDGITVSKDCADNAAPGQNLCPGNTLRKNVVFKNTDDGFDVSFGRSLLEENISFYNGPIGNRGYKILRHVDSLTFIRNIAYGNDGPGFEFRIDTGGIYYHNAAIGNSGFGITGIGGYNTTARNNLGAYNTSTDIVTGGCTGCSIGNNWREDISGDPKLVNAGFAVNINFAVGISVTQKLDFIRTQFRNSLSPIDTTSGVVDSGLVLTSYHCPTADDDAVNPMSPNSPCSHWLRTNPDIGVYEYNLAPNNCSGFGIVLSSVSHVSCNGDSTGMVDAAVMAGTSPYQYNWSNGAATQDVSALPAGAYTLTVTDALGCTVTLTVSITELAALSYTISSTPDNGNSDGTAVVNLAGGAPPYTYQWSTGQTTQTASGLAAGTYTIIASDTNNCQIIDSVVVGTVVGIRESESTKGISILPNPNNGKFNLYFTELQENNLMLEVINTLGEVVYIETVKSGSGKFIGEIDISDFSNGLYFLRIKSDGGSVSCKILKQ